NIGVNEIEIYGKGLGIPSYILHRISDEFKEKGYSPTLNDFAKFDKMYSYVNKAYYNDGDIYYSSYKHWSK
ncbi:XRE family transcriptional regulator, partial [Staphylococcus aureus]